MLFRQTKEQLMLAIEEYRRTKDVIVLGKMNNGKMENISDL